MRKLTGVALICGLALIATQSVGSAAKPVAEEHVAKGRATASETAKHKRRVIAMALRGLEWNVEHLDRRRLFYDGHPNGVSKAEWHAAVKGDQRLQRLYHGFAEHKQDVLEAALRHYQRQLEGAKKQPNSLIFVLIPPGISETEWEAAVKEDRALQRLLPKHSARPPQKRTKPQRARGWLIGTIVRYSGEEEHGPPPNLGGWVHILGSHGESWGTLIENPEVPGNGLWFPLAPGEYRVFASVSSTGPEACVRTVHIRSGKTTKVQLAIGCELK